MVTLEKAKEYLRIEPDMTDDNAMLSDMMETAKAYIQRSTGKAYKADDLVFDMAILQLTAHWYDTRQQTAAKSGAEYALPFSCKNLMLHISNSRHYAALESDTT